MVNGPAAPGSPEMTANFAPFLSDGGGSPHLICAGLIMTCAEVDAAAGGGGVVAAGGALVESCAATGIARARPRAKASRVDFTTASLRVHCAIRFPNAAAFQSTPLAPRT